MRGQDVIGRTRRKIPARWLKLLLRRQRPPCALMIARSQSGLPRPSPLCDMLPPGAGWQRGFEANWLSVTFSTAVFLGNGLVAIISGLLANTLVKNLGLGPVAPFDAAATLLAVGMAIIISTWPENFGDASEGRSLMQQFQLAASAIASGELREKCCV